MYHVEFGIMVLIPWQELSSDALAGLIEAFVLREGTDYGDGAQSAPTLASKRSAVQQQLEAGVAVIVYHADIESVDIRLASELDGI